MCASQQCADTIYTEGVATAATVAASIHDLRQKRVHTIGLARLRMGVSFRANAMINDGTHSTSDPETLRHSSNGEERSPRRRSFSRSRVSIFIPFLRCHPARIRSVSRLRIHWYIAGHPSPVSEQRPIFPTARKGKKINVTSQNGAPWCLRCSLFKRATQISFLPWISRLERNRRH